MMAVTAAFGIWALAAGAVLLPTALAHTLFNRKRLRRWALRHLSPHDSLTRLPNRALAHQSVESRFPTDLARHQLLFTPRQQRLLGVRPMRP